MVATAQAPLVKKSAGESEEVLVSLYERAFPAVAKFVSRMGGSLEAARDIFQDALVIYLEGSAQKSTVIHTSKEAYILGIAKHLWLRKYQRDQRHVPLSEAEHRISLPEDFFPDVRTRRLLRFLEVSGKKCMDLLRAFYYQSLPVKKVVDVLGYANEHSASVQKYKCLEKIRTVVKEKSLTYDDFTE